MAGGGIITAKKPLVDDELLEKVAIGAGTLGAIFIALMGGSILQKRIPYDPISTQLLAMSPFLGGDEVPALTKEQIKIYNRMYDEIARDAARQKRGEIPAPVVPGTISNEGEWSTEVLQLG